MMNLRLNTINWKVLAEASEKLEGELASQPILGLVRAEVTLSGVEPSAARGYPGYILLDRSGSRRGSRWRRAARASRTPHAVRGGRRARETRRQFSIYRSLRAQPRVAENEDWNAFADGLAGDVGRVAETVAGRTSTKVRYDAKVTEELRSDRGR